MTTNVLKPAARYDGGIRTLTNAIDRLGTSYGPAAVALLEPLRIRLHLCLQRDVEMGVGHLTADSWSALKSLARFFDNSEPPFEEHCLTTQPAIRPPVLRPWRRVAEQRYRSRALEINECIVRQVSADVLAPLLTHSFVVGPENELRVCAIPNDPIDTILRRSSVDGRIVHPMLAADFAFHVIAAGELSVFANGHRRTAVITTASGHYRPRHLNAHAVWSILRATLVSFSCVAIVTVNDSGVFRLETTSIRSEAC